MNLETHPCAVIVKESLEKIKDIVYEGWEEDAYDFKDQQEMPMIWSSILEDTFYGLIRDSQLYSIISFYNPEVEYERNPEGISNYRDILKHIWDVPPYTKQYLK